MSFDLFRSNPTYKKAVVFSIYLNNVPTRSKNIILQAQNIPIDNVLLRFKNHLFYLSPFNFVSFYICVIFVLFFLYSLKNDLDIYIYIYIYIYI